MNTRLFWGHGIAALLLASGAAAAEPTATVGDAQALARKIDQHIAKRWTEARVAPASPSDDAEFLRRVSLDLAGRIPSVEQTRSFLDDKREEKRARVIEQLLNGPRYAAHFTNFWRGMLLPEAGNNFQVRLQQGGFDNWLKQQLARNAHYDQMVRDLLTAPIGGGEGALAFASIISAGPLPYYLAKEFKPENLAAGTARVFLGVSVECAQCHNHPFADWKREQFWGFAAFFAGIKSQRQMDFLLPSGDDKDKHEIALPGTEKVIQARFLDGTTPNWEAGGGNRATLAKWVTAKGNPYFAKAAVNRIWAYFMGTGLVEPLNEMVGANTTSNHPALLDLLADEFAEHDFDLKFLMQAITLSRPYQLTSARTHKGHDDPTLFASMPLRGLTGEQLFDSVATATGYRDAGGDDGLLSGLLGGSRSARSEFLTRLRPYRPRHGIADVHSPGAVADERQGDLGRHHRGAQRNPRRRRRCSFPDRCSARRNSLPRHPVAQAGYQGTGPQRQVHPRSGVKRKGQEGRREQRAGGPVLGAAQQPGIRVESLSRQTGASRAA